MQEAIGYGHKVGIPCVIVNVMRVGPGTGMPTMPGQGDLNQTRYGSTGDYTSIVFYPSTVAECYEYTIHAFNAAEESRSPVIILSDAFLGHLNEVADLDEIEVPVVPRTLEPLASGSTGSSRAWPRTPTASRPRPTATSSSASTRVADPASRWRSATRSTNTAGTRTPRRW
jgi:pyruvate/2-oxoacid:ferredoxin oxidoreductase alpha subunit